MLYYNQGNAICQNNQYSHCTAHYTRWSPYLLTKLCLQGHMKSQQGCRLSDFQEDDGAVMNHI